MSKIKVYKGTNGVIIPTESAIIADGFRCPWTNKIFCAKKEYIKHLRTVREDIIYRKIRAKAIQKQFDQLLNQPTFEDIIAWIESNSQFFLKFRNNPPRLPIFSPDDAFKIEITYLNLNWSNNVSNSHSCPRGDVTNWSRKDKDRPTGYPGWAGRIEYQVSHALDFNYELFSNTGIHTGTGGGHGSKKFGYDVTLFSSDWPGLEKSVCIDILKEETPKCFFHGAPKYFVSICMLHEG